MKDSNQVAVIMFPFLAHSHLNQLLQLSCLITSSSSIPVHYVSSSIHIKQAKTRAHNLNPSHVAKIRFHCLPMPDFESPPPNPDSSINFPTQLLPLFDAATSLRQPFACYLHEMSRVFRRVVVIHDYMTSSLVQDVASIENAESYVFNPLSALTMASLLFAESDERILKDLPSIDDCVPGEVWELLASQREPSKHRSGDLYNTVRSLEAAFLDILARNDDSEDRKTWAIGPMLPMKPSSWDHESRHECLKWLDKHEPDSVIYVSFGTSTTLSDEQVRELASGLERSGAKFLWILRDADRGNVFNGGVRRLKQLPRGFEERNKGVGLIVRDWAPQIDILAHPSTGGFVSHCGWNSVLESLTMGVPIATWPMHSEQPRNAYFVTEILKAGVAVRERTWKDVTKSSVIAEAVRRLMMASEEGDSIRRRVREIGANLRRATEEGGESKVEMDMFIAHITRD